MTKLTFFNFKINKQIFYHVLHDIKNSITNNESIF